MSLNRQLMIGVLVALWGAITVFYSALGLFGISLGREGAGIGAFPNLGTYLGLLFITAGVAVAITSQNQKMK